MSAEDFRPPDYDNQVIIVLREILTYFKNCDNISSNSPYIMEQIRKIREQRSEFRTCLERSIAYSNNLKTHAESTINQLESLEDQNSDLSRISDVLRILFENTKQNKEVTLQIKKNYDTIKGNLKKISKDIYEREVDDRNKLQSLKRDSDELEERLKNQKFFVIIFLLLDVFFMFCQ